MRVDTAVLGTTETECSAVRRPIIKVVCIFLAHEPCTALRVEDTTPGWSDIPDEQLPDEQLMYLGRS